MHAMTLPRAALKGAAASVCLLAALVSAGCGGGGSDSGGGTTPVVTTFTLGGTVGGLTAAGLVLANGTATATVASGATTFAFATPLNSGTAYAVTVQTQPTGQTCTVANGSGTITANVSNVAVTCTTTAAQTFTLGGTVSGLTTAGLVVGNGSGNTVTVAANATSFTLPTAVAVGATYAVTVTTQPTGLNCTVASGTGTMPSANVTNVAVTCVPRTFTVGGTVSGLTSSGLVLANGSGNTVTVAANATTFTLPTAVAFGTAYAVTVTTQPTGLTCAVASGAGTMGAANVTNVAVTCTVNTYTLGGTISGLTTAGLVLANGSGNTVTVAANATTFTLPTQVAFGAAYAVTIQTQPAALTCTLTGATGTMPGAAVTSVTVTCTVPASLGWTWVAGDNNTFVAANFGPLNTPLSTNKPGSRWETEGFKDSSGNLWIFAGDGAGAIAFGRLNDLWKYDVNTTLWTWVAGSGSVDVNGSYGTQGVAGPSSQPGSRINPVTWVDAAGNFWAFGGEGLGATTSTVGYLNDLWKFNPTTGNWTWVSGSTAINGSGAYGGAPGTPSAGINPGARRSAARWVDSAGNLWLFGGVGRDSAGTAGPLNDLWKYNPTSGLWTWVSGSTVVNAASVFGTQGTAAAGNTPGNRQQPQYWADLSGNLWLFGGFSSATLNDLWKFSPTSGLWTWMGGSTSTAATGTYGSQGVASASSFPGARNGGASWVDAAGSFWLFGGFGRDSGTNGSAVGLNDLWKYVPSTGLWTWVGGPTAGGGAGTYGTKGTASFSNIPGVRNNMAFWIDNAGKLTLFGGQGSDGSGNNGLLNDMWKY